MSTTNTMKGTAANGRSFYTRVSALGFGLIALTGAVVLVLGLLTGGGEEAISFALVFIAVGLLVAGAVWRWGRWTLVIAALLSLALIGLVGPFSVFSLIHPESATDFIPVVLLLAGALLGLIGSIVAIVQGRRRTGRTSANKTERLVLGAMLGGVVVAVLLSIVLTLAGRSGVSAEAKAGASSMQIKYFTFAPNYLEAKTGDTVRIAIQNDDSTMHTFTLAAAGVDVAIPPGNERMVEFKAPAPGTYQYYCIPHSQESGGMHEGMVGTLQVE